MSTVRKPVNDDVDRLRGVSLAGRNNPLDVMGEEGGGGKKWREEEDA